MISILLYSCFEILRDNFFQELHETGHNTHQHTHTHNTYQQYVLAKHRPDLGIGRDLNAFSKNELLFWISKLWRNFGSAWGILCKVPQSQDLCFWVRWNMWEKITQFAQMWTHSPFHGDLCPICEGIAGLTKAFFDFDTVDGRNPAPVEVGSFPHYS